MVRTVVLSALLLAAGAFLLQWLDFKQATHALAPELYVALIAVAFTAVGLWAGWRLAARRRGPGFVRNEAARGALNITGQEMRVLEQLASGQSNKAIARALGLSPNTIKTHLASLFTKLQAATRTQAVGRARDLDLIP